MADKHSKSDSPNTPSPVSRRGGAFLERVERYLNGASTADEIALLRQDLAQDPGNRDAFVQLSIITARLSERFAPNHAQGDLSGWFGQGESTKPASVRIIPRKNPASQPARRWRGSGWAAALVVACGIVAVLLWPGHPASQVVGHFTDGVELTWQSSHAISPGQAITIGQSIFLEQGIARIELTGGTALLLQGPARIRFDSAERVSCLVGKMTVAVGTSDSGKFVVMTPSARINDVGTEFGVRVFPAGDTTCEVFQGEIGLTPVASSSESVETITIDASRPMRIAMGSTSFVNTAIGQKFVRSLDEARPALATPSTAPAGVVGRLPAAPVVHKPTAWAKSERNPVLRSLHGALADVAVLKDGPVYTMYFSRTESRSIEWTQSADGVKWSPARLALGPEESSGWEHMINRPVVVKTDDAYHLWYTGQANNHSWIGHATSPDGKTWMRGGHDPVLRVDQPWEKVAVMCPHVMWDASAKMFKMWYSAGDQFEPDAIGYATSTDGESWHKNAANPIFTASSANDWEGYKVNGCQVVRQGEWFVMLYIGFKDDQHPQIGIARSKDGITRWQRLASNPVIGPTAGSWDADGCYKPFAIYNADDDSWKLWYNGRRGGEQQIGLASRFGVDLFADGNK